MQSCLPGEPLTKPPGNGTGGSRVAPLQDGTQPGGRSGLALPGGHAWESCTCAPKADNTCPLRWAEKLPRKNPSKGPNTLYYKP